MPTPALPPLADLLTALEAAVRAGDRARATQLAQAILQRLASEAAEGASLERRMRALMAHLDQSVAAPRVSFPDPFSLERGSSVPAPPLAWSIPCGSAPTASPRRRAMVLRASVTTARRLAASRCMCQRPTAA